MATYINPSVSIQQEFDLLPTATLQALNAVVVGPQKQVVDYNTATNTSTLGYGSYAAIAGEAQEVLSLPAGAVIDPSSLQLTLTSVKAEYATLGYSGSSYVANGVRKVSGKTNQVALSSGISGSLVQSPGYGRNAALANRDVQVGDYVKVSDAAGDVLNTRVTGFVADVIAASFGSFTAGAANPGAQSYSATPSVVVAAETVGGAANRTFAVDTSDTTYVGKLVKGVINDTYILTCVSSGAASVALWNVTSLKGDNVPNIVIPAESSNTPFAVGTAGLQVTLEGGDAVYYAGESYQVVVAAQYVAVTPSIVSSAYEGAINTTYIVTVVKGGTWAQNPLVTVQATNGIDYSPAAVVSAHDAVLSLGALGATFEFSDVAQGGLRLGDSYSVTATAAAPGAIRTLTLAAPLPSAITTNDLRLDLYLYQAKTVVPVSNYPLYGDTALTFDSASNTFVVSALQVLDPSWTEIGTTVQEPLDVVDAQVYLGYTALLTANANVYGTVASAADVATALGQVVESNPLAYATYLAAANAGGQPVGYIAVESDDLAGYNAALAALESVAEAYFIVPVSQDLSVLQAVQAHVDNMSNPAYNAERVAFLSQVVPQVVELLGSPDGGGSWTGYVAEDPDVSGLFNRVTIPGATLIADGVKAGDIFRTNYVINSDGSTSYQTALVQSVIDDHNLVLANPAFTSAVGSSGTPIQVGLVRLLSKQAYATAIAGVSSAYGDRRVFNVWPDTAVDANAKVVPGSYVAAAAAGFKSSVAPHQGITNHTLIGFSSIPKGSLFFTPDQLNTIASGGTFIVNQDVNSSAIYVRHQISTDTTDPNHAELSVTTNVDAIAKFIRPELKSLIGVYNVTPQFLLLAQTCLINLIDYLATYTKTPTAGAQVTSYDPTQFTVVQDPVLKTRVVAVVPIGVPGPLNNFDLTLVVS